MAQGRFAGIQPRFAALVKREYQPENASSKTIGEGKSGKAETTDNEKPMDDKEENKQKEVGKTSVEPPPIIVSSADEEARESGSARASRESEF